MHEKKCLVSRDMAQPDILEDAPFLFRAPVAVPIVFGKRLSKRLLIGGERCDLIGMKILDRTCTVCNEPRSPDRNPIGFPVPAPQVRLEAPHLQHRVQTLGREANGPRRAPAKKMGSDQSLRRENAAQSLDRFPRRVPLEPNGFVEEIGLRLVRPCSMPTACEMNEEMFGVQ